MRTTLDIEDDVLAAAKEIARRQRLSTGQVVSNLLRKTLSGLDPAVPASHPQPPSVGGFRPFPSQGVVITDEQINALRDAEGL